MRPVAASVPEPLAFQDRSFKALRSFFALCAARIRAQDDLPLGKRKRHRPLF